MSRFDVDALDGTASELYVKRGHFVANVELFDNVCFGISAHEAKHIDPQQRLLLEAGFDALVRAGHTKETLMGRDIGVFVGICVTH